jgi:hyperosmotically inducible periplasmic protein
MWNRRIATVSGIALLVALIMIDVRAAAAGQPDAWITTKVKMSLITADNVDAMPINVDTVDGRVVLHGKVPTEQMKDKAEEVARSVSGVREVKNLLQILPPGKQEEAVAADDAKIKERVEKALKDDRTFSRSDIAVRSVNKGVVLLGGTANTMSAQLRALEVAAEVPGVHKVASEIQGPEGLSDQEVWRKTSGAQTPVTVANDLWITSAAKMRLIAQPETPALDINVDTRNGEVTLFGIVPSEESKRQAETEVKMVEGVKRVHNELEVVAKEKQKAVAVKDDALEKRVDQVIKDDPDLKTASIKVQVKNGVARLTGIVERPEDCQVAAYAARRVDGVRAVEDDLQIKNERVD